MHNPETATQRKPSATKQATLQQALREMHSHSEHNRLPVKEWLNSYFESVTGSRFEERDFSKIRKGLDPVLLSAAVFWGLKSGFGYNQLRANIDMLCSDQQTLSDEHRAFPEDHKELAALLSQRLAGDSMSDLPFRAATCISRLVDDLPPKFDPGMESACLTGLYSFLKGRKKLFVRDAVSALRASSLKTSTIWQYLDGGIPKENWKALRMPKVMPAIPVIDLKKLYSREPETALRHIRQVAGDMEIFCSSMLNEGALKHGRPEDIEQKSQVTDFFAKNPAKLQKLYSAVFRLLQSRLRINPATTQSAYGQRQLLFASPMAALQTASRVENKYQQIFGLLTCLLTDFSKTLELKDPQVNQELARYHPQISAAIAARLLAKTPQIPACVGNEIILAIRMQENKGVDNSPISSFVKSARRLTMIGPEALIRGISAMNGNDRGFYPETAFSRDSLFGDLSFHLHHIYQNLSAASELEYKLLLTTGIMLKLACTGSSALEARLFNTSGQQGSPWKSLNPSVLRSITTAIRAILEHGTCSTWPDLTEADRDSLQPPDLISELTSLDYGLQPLVQERVDAAKSLNPIGFTAALRFAAASACLYQQEQTELLKKFQSSNSTAIKALAIVTQEFNKKS